MNILHIVTLASALIFLEKKAPPQNDLYSIQFPSLDSGQININDYSGQKLMIIAFDASNPNAAELQWVDSLYNNSSDSVDIIGIPVTDFGSPSLDSATLVNLLRDSLNINFPVAAVSQGKRGMGQQILMQWITTNSLQNPYNVDLTTPDEIFVISTTGTLYAVLDNSFPMNSPLMTSILTSQPSQ